MKKIDESIMYLFKGYLIDEKCHSFVPDYLALKKGILINISCSQEIIDLAIKMWGIDGFILNQTFHKSLSTVINSNIEDLFMEQLVHYFTTYGFESLGIYNRENVYIPYEKLEIPELNDDINLINISPITKSELKEKLWNLINSSIALSKKTIQCIIDLSDYLEITKSNIDDVTNKEIKTALYYKFDIVPKNNIEFLRYLVYILTDSTLLIKNSEIFLKLKMSEKSVALKLLNNYKELYGLDKLSEIFNRYKKIFLSLKTSSNDDLNNRKYELKYEEIELNRLINRISKLSKKNHKPFVSKPLDNFIFWYNENISKSNYLELLKDVLFNENIWGIIKLRNYISLINSGILERTYVIRNGKIWVTCKSNKYLIGNETINYLDSLIINKLKTNVFNKKIYMDDNTNLILPQSEKQFMGNIPFSSSYVFEKDDILVGIHWFNIDDDRVDLDLKIISNDYSIGWDCNYKESDKLVFTGDVTDAPYPNGASEYIYISKDLNNTIFSIKVNNYTRNYDDIEYDIIIAKKSEKSLEENYIVDPNDIILKIPKNIIEKDRFEHSIGNIIIDNDCIKIVFTDMVTSNRSTSFNSDIEEYLRKYVSNDSNIRCSFNNYLKRAGAIIVNDRNDACIDLSLNNINRDMLIDMFK